jgi:hypothetical protein
MERTVPRTDSDEIDLYIRTYYSLLRSSGEIQIETLAESHISTDSLLHPRARVETPDISALVYSSLRLPNCIRSTRLVVLGQRNAVFDRWGYHVESWQEVSARARRRRAFFDGQDTMALFITSRSDIDDILPSLTAYQIEWNKLHRLLGTTQGKLLLSQLSADGQIKEDELATLAGALGISLDDMERLAIAWGSETVEILQEIASHRKSFAFRLLAGSLADYRKAVHFWWQHIADETPHLSYEQRRVYFISSNTHSIANLWSGYALRHQDELLEHMKQAGHEDLLAEYHDIEAEAVPSNRENFFYYVLKKYLQDHGREARTHHTADEREVGLHRIASEQGFELDAQVIELGQARLEWLDPRIACNGIELLRRSDALIINIDYPLGLAAYELLAEIYENVGRIEGVYAMGKAATLNGKVGDIMIPSVVHDEHSDNTYLFNNCFTAGDVAPYLTYGTVLDNQKSVTVRGTFLQNVRYMGVFYREGYTDIEMEAGPYLSAVYEMVQPKRHPYNEIVSLHGAHLDVGIIHYASDTPLSKGQNLGAGNLSYRGMDPTYAATAAILRQIIVQEIAYQSVTTV